MAKIIGGQDHNDQPVICERCGAPIIHELIVLDDNGDEHSYGSTCAYRMIGDAETERRTREGMERHRAERERIKSALRDHDPERQSKLRRVAELNRTDPQAALKLLYEMSQEKKHDYTQARST